MGTRAGRKVRWLKHGRVRGRKLPALCAESGFYNLHAAVRIGAENRYGLERLCRYVTRPPLSHARLMQREDSTLALRLKTPWADGTTLLVLSEMELLKRTFGCDVLRCPKPGCGGRLEVRAVVRGAWNALMLLKVAEYPVERLEQLELSPARGTPDETAWC